MSVSRWLLRAFMGIAVTASSLNASSRAAAAEAPMSGKALFAEKCSMCHGARGMATFLLSRRMPAAEAPLEARTNLAAGYVVQAARLGIGNMPRIPRGEVSDGQLAAIAAYLARRPSK